MEAPSTLTSPTPATITPAPTYRPEPWPPVFLLGVRPLSVDGHIFTQDYDPIGSFRIRIDCPTANVSTDHRTPDDDGGDEQCRRADLFPAEVWHEVYRSYGAWGGTFTPSAAPAKTWRCEVPNYILGDLATVTGPVSAGNCSQWESATSSASAVAATTTASLDQCAMLRSRVPLRLTGAGIEGQWEDYSAGYAGYPLSPNPFNEWVAEALSSLGCPDPTSLLGFGVMEATATSEASGPGTAAADSASAGAGSRGEKVGSAAFVCLALACASLVAGLLPTPWY